MQLDINQNDVTMSNLEMKGGIKDLAMPPVSHPAGVPRGKKEHTQHVGRYSVLATAV